MQTVQKKLNDREDKHTIPVLQSNIDEIKKALLMQFEYGYIRRIKKQ